MTAEDIAAHKLAWQLGIADPYAMRAHMSLRLWSRWLLFMSKHPPIEDRLDNMNARLFWATLKMTMGRKFKRTIKQCLPKWGVSQSRVGVELLYAKFAALSRRFGGRQRDPSDTRANARRISERGKETD